MTRGELYLVLRGYRERLATKARMAKSSAWMTAYLGRVKRLPRYDDWMSERSAPRPLSDEEVTEGKALLAEAAAAAGWSVAS